MSSRRVGPGSPPLTPSKLSPAQRDNALACLARGDSYRTIAAAFGVSHQTIYRLAQRARGAKGEMP